MKLHAPKLLGLAAITLALGAIATVGTSQACEKSAKAEQAKATASSESGCAAAKAAMTASTKSTTKARKASYAAGSSCNYSKTTTAKYAAGDACCLMDCCDVGAAKAVLASGATGCEARKAQMVLANAEALEAHAAHAVHATHGAHAEHATALASSEGCASHKAKTSAALASSDGCAAHKAKTSAALASSDGCGSHEAKAKSAALASADGCAAHKSAALADAKSGCTMEKSAAFASACARYEACSVKADLAHAKDADLDLYEKEKMQDGKAISGVKLPAFYATDLQGNKVSSKDLKGTPTVLVLLATHCGHSYQSLPILTAAAEEFGPRGLRVVGLVVGSSPEKAKGWFEGETTHEVWVTEDLTVADQLKSHLVPTYVLVDAKGNVKTKLVGFKKDTEVKENIPVLLVHTGATESSNS